MKHVIKKHIRDMGAIEVRQMLCDMLDEMTRIVMKNRNCVNLNNCKWIVYGYYGLTCLKNVLDTSNNHTIPFEMNEKNEYKLFDIDIEVIPKSILSYGEEYSIELVYDDRQNYHEMFNPSEFYSKELLIQYYGLWRNDEMIPEIKRVIFNRPATIVLWKDGSKTVVKCQEGDVFNLEKGLAMCIIKKLSGNKGNFNDIFRKWIPNN